MEQIDLSAPPRHAGLGAPRVDSARGPAARARIPADDLAARGRAARGGWAAIEAQERERRRIAQDLHDEVNQALTAGHARLQASISKRRPQLQQELQETKRLYGQAMEELLSLAPAPARGPRRPRPAGRAAQSGAGLRRPDGDARAIHGAGAGTDADARAAAGVYRVTQESLSNIAQHADAKNVDVELSFVSRAVLRISDDGYGFSAAATAGSGSRGCASARSSPGVNCRSGRRRSRNAGRADDCM